MTLQRLTQKQRILLELRRAGDKGIDQTMFLAPNVCDGDKPITRVAARIMELRDEGFPIREGGWRHTCRVYILDEAALERQLATRQPDEPVSDDAPAALFGDEVGAAPPRSAYDREAA